MKAIVLAAGKGTRLGDLTKDIPKPMLPVNGVPLLERILLWLKNNGIHEIGVNLFTMPEKIIDYFGTGAKLGVEIHYIQEKELSGTAGALPKFADWLDNEESFLVVYGDILTDQDLTPIIELHSEKNAFATILLHRRAKSNSFIKMNADGRISEFIERPDEETLKELQRRNPNGFLVNSAVQALSWRALEKISETNAFDLPKDLYIPCIDKEDIYGVELTGKRVAIDSPERLRLAEEMFPCGER